MILLFSDFYFICMGMNIETYHEKWAVLICIADFLYSNCCELNKMFLSTLYFNFNIYNLLSDDILDYILDYNLWHAFHNLLYMYLIKHVVWKVLWVKENIFSNVSPKCLTFEYQWS